MILKNILISIAASIIAMACSRNNSNEQIQELSTGDSVTLAALSKLFTLADAEKIIGEPAHITVRSMKRDGNVLSYQSGYKANAENYKTPNPGAIYFLVEQYSDVASAQKKYTDIKAANANHEGVKTLNDLGDEAYFHSDNEHFYFVMVRKNTRVFNLKVNKITGKTSLDEFNNTAKHITAAL